MKRKKLFKFLKKNYIIVVIFLSILFIGIVIGKRTFYTKPTYVYMKVKIGQGLWWATTAKPSIWYADSIKKGDVATDLLGKPQAQIINVRKYPAGNNNQYDVYITLRLKVGFNKKTGEYTFNRSTLSIGAPIEIQFAKTNITGTVTDISNTLFNDKYVERTVYLVSQGGYTKDFTYRYDDIQVGDKYFDGENNVFEVIDKYLEQNIWTIQNNLNAQVYERQIESVQNIVVKAKLKLLEKNGGHYYGEDYRVSTNSLVPFSTSRYFFENFMIRKIE